MSGGEQLRDVAIRRNDVAVISCSVECCVRLAYVTVAPSLAWRALPEVQLREWHCAADDDEDVVSGTWATPENGSGVDAGVESRTAFRVLPVGPPAATVAPGVAV